LNDSNGGRGRTSISGALAGSGKEFCSATFGIPPEISADYGIVFADTSSIQKPLNSIA
jgi:hypothetical protein